MGYKPIINGIKMGYSPSMNILLLRRRGISTPPMSHLQPDLVQDHPLLLGRRIQVVGQPGAGKSFFSKQLGSIVQAPVLHLDSVFWSEDWVSRPIEEAQSIVRGHASQPGWVIDGNQWVPLQDITYPLATDIIWIDPPIYVWVYRLVMRAIKKAWSDPASFRKDFLNPRTSIIVLALKRRAKKSRNWGKMLAKDSRWRRVTDTGEFLKSLKKGA